MQDVMGIVLGGGRGQRLYPLTKERSKPAVPLAGKYRIIDIPISNCLNSGISKIFVLTQFNSASLNRHIVQTYKFDMFTGGFVDILAAEQTPDNPNWFQGTADAVRQSIKHFEPYEDVDFIIVLSGDQLYQMDFSPMVRFHEESGAEITVAAIPVATGWATSMGVMKIQQNGRVEAFKEKPQPDELSALRCSVPRCQSNVDASREYLASMGIYVFRKRFLIDLLTESTAIDFGKELIPGAILNHRVFAYVFDGYWSDIGTVRSFYDANLDLTAPQPHFNLYNAHMPVYTHPRNLPASRLNNCNVHQSIITDGCILNGADIRHSVIGVRSRVGGGTTIKNSIIMGANRYETAQETEENRSRGIPNMGIGNHCTIINAIIDKNARIGDNVSIINAHNLQQREEQNYSICDGIIVVPKGAIIATGTVI
jgi:glucose-1-phosphate adenylyltransferase